MKLFPKINSRQSEVGQKFKEEKKKLERLIAKCLEEADVVLGTLVTCGRGNQDIGMTEITCSS